MPGAPLQYICGIRNLVMLALRLRPEIEHRLDALARKTGRSKSNFAREAILRHLDDIEDECLARPCNISAASGISSCLHFVFDPRSSIASMRSPERPAAARVILRARRSCATLMTSRTNAWRALAIYLRHQESRHACTSSSTRDRASPRCARQKDRAQQELACARGDPAADRGY